MSHIKESCLRKFISRDLDADHQEIIENHLYECEGCMDTYFAFLENHSLSITLSDDFTNQVVEKAEKQHPKSNPRQLSPKKVIANYIIAAGLTVVLMLTGVFQVFIEVTNDQQLEGRPSITEQLMHQTNQLLDQIKEVDN
ncbi:hypothetical protein [Gracilibacillus kekensis]|uniref:Zinc-finger n=1 Tax=Gracilibacillus kekensis TaxID=1027249 RepID=A0A1M7PMJ3_9BACI|nr:hypothetical protein [Gracilibacillus kekensis]SHN18494.1 hypothetical protein SAMN05216179_2352 [Gracilibacillus kekensis]